jgi:parvulin-like peptidyl-prolyl isomerase
MGDVMKDGFEKNPGENGNTGNNGDMMPHRVPIITIQRCMLLSIVLLFFLMACGSEKSPPPPAEPVVATVNGETIVLKEFEEALARETALVNRKTPLTSEETKSLKEEVLNELIRERIMLQRARDLSLAVGETELMTRIDEIRKDYSDGQFNELFGAGKIDFSEWKNALRKRILLESLIAREVNAKIQVTDQEAERYFNANRKAYVTERRVRVAQIVLPNRKQAATILKRLKAGEDFDKVAREVSIGPEAARGGDLGFFERGIMPEAIDRMVFSLKVGKLSRVAQSPYGFHIFKVLGRDAAGGENFSDVKERVIVELGKQKEAEAYKRWIEDLKAKVVIRVNRPLPDLRRADSTGTDLKSVPMQGARPPAVPGKH